MCNILCSTLDSIVIWGTFTWKSRIKISFEIDTWGMFRWASGRLREEKREREGQSQYHGHGIRNVVPLLNRFNREPSQSSSIFCDYIQRALKYRFGNFHDNWHRAFVTLTEFSSSSTQFQLKRNKFWTGIKLHPVESPSKTLLHRNWRYQFVEMSLFRVRTFLCSPFVSFVLFVWLQLLPLLLLSHPHNLTSEY